MHLVEQLKPQPNAPLVEYLEEMLEEARSGELQSLIAVTHHYPGNFTSHTYAADTGATFLQLMGEMECLKHILVREALASE